MDDGTRTKEAAPRSTLEAEGPDIRLFAPGTALASRFEIGAVRGVGGSAVVYSAFDRELRETVALKVLRADRTTPAALTRMKREVAIARQAASPRLVRVFDINATGESVFLTMEDVPGGSLKDRLAEGPVPLEETLRIAGEVLEGLAVLHGLGIVHRDVKPGNVLLAADDSVKLADFGLARRLEIDETRATSMDAVVGTVEYLSPEQALGHNLDGRSDLYSFGVTLFEMLTGGVPFRRDSAIGTALAHVRDPAPRLRSVRPDEPPWLEAYVARLLAKDPEERYATAEAALADLSSRVVGRGPDRKRSIRRRGLVVLAALGVIGGAMVLVPRVLAPRALARIVTRSEGTGIRALDAKGRVLWERRGVTDAATAVAFRARGGDQRVAAVETDPATDVVGPEGVRLLILASRTGRETGRMVIRLATEAAFPGISRSFAVVAVDAVDVDDDHDDEILLTVCHRELYPAMVLLADPDTGTSEPVYESSGHPVYLGRLDVDGDRKGELLFAGPVNRLGNYVGVAAVRLRPADDGRAVFRRFSQAATTPDQPSYEASEKRLAWFTLGPAYRGREKEPFLVDPAHGTLRISGFSSAPFLLRFDGSRADAASHSGPGELLETRSAAWRLLARAGRLAGSGDPAAAAAEAAEAVSRLRLSADPSMLEWALRTEARNRIAAGAPVEGERLFEEASRGSTAGVSIALDAARALHLAGWPGRALPWYERAVLSRDGEAELWILRDGLEDAVLALAELGRVEEAVPLAEKADVTLPVKAEIRRFAAVRAGRAPRTAGREEVPETALQRCWRLEEALVSGVPAERVLAEARSTPTSEESHAALARLVESEALSRLDRASEALPVAEEAFSRLWERRRSQVAARAYLGTAADRLCSCLSALGRTAEAGRVRRMVRGFFSPGKPAGPR